MALCQEAFGEDIVFQQIAVAVSLGFGHADCDHQQGIVPYVDGGGSVGAFLALLANELSDQCRRQCLGDFGFANTRFAFQK